MLISNVNELKTGDTIQYIGNTLGLFGKLMEVVSIDEQKNQCHVKTLDHYLTRCDAKNVLKLSNNINVMTRLNVRGEKPFSQVFFDKVGVMYAVF